MTTLCIDTATAFTAVAIGDRQHSVEAPRGHAEHLADLIRRALADADITLADIDAIVVGVGPGLYTGLRVGVVTAQMMSLATGVAVTGVCSLDGLGLRIGDGVVVTDARRKEVFAAQYRDGRRIGDPLVISPDEVARLWPDDQVIGPGVDAHPGLAGQSMPLSIVEFPRVTAQLPVRAWYLRAADAKPAS